MVYEVEGSEVSLLDEEWDLCVIIDSCRYDVFESCYRKLLNTRAKVKKARSRCFSTKEFMQKNLNRSFIDVVFINHIVSIDYWIPNTTFANRFDIWKTDWDYETWGTVLPWDVTKESIEKKKQFPDKRFLVHYVQPHPPYLLPGYEEFGKEMTPERAIAIQEKRRSHKGLKRYRGFSSFYQGVLRNHIGYERTWKLLNLLGIDPVDGYGRMYKKFGWKGLVEGYHKNTILVLEEVKKLIDKFNGKVLITADHSQRYDGDRRGIRKEYIPWLVL